MRDSGGTGILPVTNTAKMAVPQGVRLTRRQRVRLKGVL